MRGWRLRQSGQRVHRDRGPCCQPQRRLVSCLSGCIHLSSCSLGWDCELPGAGVCAARGPLRAGARARQGTNSSNLGVKSWHGGQGRLQARCSREPHVAGHVRLQTLAPQGRSQAWGHSTSDRYQVCGHPPLQEGLCGTFIPRDGRLWLSCLALPTKPARSPGAGAAPGMELTLAGGRALAHGSQGSSLLSHCAPQHGPRRPESRSGHGPGLLVAQPVSCRGRWADAR